MPMETLPPLVVMIVVEVDTSHTTKSSNGYISLFSPFIGQLISLYIQPPNCRPPTAHATSPHAPFILK